MEKGNGQDGTIDCEKGADVVGLLGEALCGRLLGRLCERLGAIADLMASVAAGSPWLTVSEGERYAHARHGVLREAIERGELPAHQRARNSAILVLRSDLDSWIRSWPAPEPPAGTVPVPHPRNPSGTDQWARRPRREDRRVRAVRHPSQRRRA